MRLRVRQLRKQQPGGELTQVELAERSGVSQPVISQIENGRANPTVEVLELIAAALDVAVPDLFEREGEGPEVAEIMSRLAQLSPDHQRQVRDFVAFLAAQQPRISR